MSAGSSPASGANLKTNNMKNNRIKLFEFTDLTQATILKIVNEKDIDCIRVSVYGYTGIFDHIEFSYDLEFPDEKTRDQTFEEIKKDKMFEDVKKIVASLRIPILI